MKKATLDKTVVCAAAVLLLAATGCVRKTLEPAYSPRVGTSQNGDGEVTISFESRPGYKYKIYVMNPETRQWKPLPRSQIYYGNGKPIVVKDQRDPRKPIPWYSVRAEPR